MDVKKKEGGQFLFTKLSQNKSLLKTIETNCEWNNIASEKNDNVKCISDFGFSFPKCLFALEKVL